MSSHTGIVQTNKMCRRLRVSRYWFFLLTIFALTNLTLGISVIDEPCADENGEVLYVDPNNPDGVPESQAQPGSKIMKACKSRGCLSMIGLGIY